MSAPLLLASLAYLAWALFISFRKTIPTWLHRFYARHQQLKSQSDVRELFSKVILLHGLVILLAVVSVYVIVCAAGLISLSLIRNSIWPLLTLVLMIGVAWVVGRNLTRHWSNTQDVESETEANDTLTVSDGRSMWATGDDIRKRLSTGKPSDTVIGIHIGEGVHWNEKGHMFCVADAGQDKTDNLLLPALLSEGLMEIGASVVCLDPDGKMAAVAAPHFLRNSYDVHIVNPFKIAGLAHFGNSRFNPLDQIKTTTPGAAQHYDMLAMAIHNRNGQSASSPFDDLCRQYISLYIAFTCHIGTTNVETLCKSLRFPSDARAIRLGQMAGDSTFERRHIATAILDRLNGEKSEFDEQIFSAIAESIKVFEDKNLLASLTASDFDLRNVAYQPTAIFVCIPAGTLATHAAWVRMFFGSLLHTLARFYNPERKVLVLLDEFLQLSYMDEIVKSMSVLRGYNVTLWTIIDSLKQLRNIYKSHDELFLNSASVKHWLSYGSDDFTADYIKSRMPEVSTPTENTSDNSPNENQTQTVERDDAINSDYMVCDLSGLSQPIRFGRRPYWHNPFCKDNASSSPVFR